MKGQIDLRLGITREKNQLAELIQKGAKRNIDVCSLPLTIIVPIPFEWPSELLVESVGWLVFTSGNGVRIFFERLAVLGLTIPDSTKIAVIGEKTEKALESACGRSADIVPGDGHGESFFTEFVAAVNLADQNVVHVRAEEIIFDPAELLKKCGIKYWPLICYRTESREVAKETLAQFCTDDYILFTSPSAVRSFIAQFDSPISRLLAIGNTTASAMDKAGWSKPKILEIKNIDTVLEYI